MLEVQQERDMKIATLNHVQCGQIGIHCPVINVTQLVVEERLEKDHIAY